MWEHSGIICTGETYKSVVKLTFAKGTARRAIYIHAGDQINAEALKALIRATAAAPDSADGATLWSTYLSSWTMWNTVRAIAALAASGAYIWALRLLAAP
jgi:uncharacterized membrane protein